MRDAHIIAEAGIRVVTVCGVVGAAWRAGIAGDRVGRADDGAVCDGQDVCVALAVCRHLLPIESISEYPGMGCKKTGLAITDPGTKVRAALHQVDAAFERQLPICGRAARLGSSCHLHQMGSRLRCYESIPDSV